MPTFVSLSCLPRYTGGNTYFYPALSAARSEDALKFAHEFGQVLASPIALEAVMRVRASRGKRQLKLLSFALDLSVSLAWVCRYPFVRLPREFLCPLYRFSSSTDGTDGPIICDRTSDVSVGNVELTTIHALIHLVL